MDLNALQQYLYDHIPLSKAMEVTIAAADWDSVRLRAPLAPNINHRDTVFGGSTSAMALLSAWALVYLRLERENIRCHIVVRRNSMVYDKPIPGEFEATSSIADDAAWTDFVAVLSRRNRARIEVESLIHSSGELAAKMSGEFVGLAGG